MRSVAAIINDRSRTQVSD